MNIKTSKLSGIALEYAIAKGRELILYKDSYLGGQLHSGWHVSGLHTDLNYWRPLESLNVSTHWAVAGPILSKANISRTIDHSGLWIAYWTSGYVDGDAGRMWMNCNRSELVAGLRTYVGLTLGATVDIPDDLAIGCEHWI